MSIIQKVIVKEIKPDMSKFPAQAKKFYCPETNTRIATTFKYKKPAPGSKEEYELCYARNQIFKNQYKIPVKYLQPDKGSRYVAQKAPLTEKSNDILSAAKTIEPLNIGFDEFIRTIPINQKIPVGTYYTIHVSVPYDSETRYFFCSNQLKRTDKKTNGGPDFDPFIHIGCLDIGSDYNAKFKVEQVDLKIYDSYTLFTFDINEEAGEFTIYTYKFQQVSVKEILQERLKKSDSRGTKFIEECIKALK